MEASNRHGLGRRLADRIVPEIDDRRLILRTNRDRRLKGRLGRNKESVDLRRRRRRERSNDEPNHCDG